MAIGTVAAIGLGLGAIGSVASGISANSAAGKAADTSLAVAEKNNALTREIYGQNKDMISPFVGTGTAATGQINALLGLPSAGGAADYAAYATANPDVLAEWNNGVNNSGAFQTLGDFGKYHYDRYGQAEGRQMGNNALGQQQAAEDAFARYRDSTGYKFRLGEGFDAVKSGYAGRGMVQSGAALKSLNDYGQGMASQEFGNYLNALGNQQGVGLSGASALAGVGQNYVNTISNNNNNAGTAVANAALAKGANNPFGNALGMIGGGLYGMGR